MISLPVRLVRLLLWLVALPFLLTRRLITRPPRNAYLGIDIDGAIDEFPLLSRWWDPAASRRFSLHGFASIVAATAQDSRVQGLLLTVKSMRGGFAIATSLRDAIVRAKSQGKRVVVHFSGGRREQGCLLRLGGRPHSLGAASGAGTSRVLSSARYLRGALDRAGVVPEIHAQGRFKTAAERLERRDMSAAQREQVGAILDGVYAELVRALAEGRHVDEARARAMIDEAPYVGREAANAGVVDDIAYEDEVGQRLTAEGAKHAIVPAAGYMKARTALRPWGLASRGVVGVLQAHGPIVGDMSMPFSKVVADDRLIAAIRSCRAARRVRGVILHIDSPGGSALASDRIHHELEQLAAEKPLVACMGDVAASGGYYIATAAHEIVAQPTTITGSIGVIAARVVLDPLLARLGVTTEVLQRGANARLLNPLLPLEDREKRAIDREIDGMYQAFLRIVARGRRRSVEAIEPLAQGRVWTGADAQKYGLVDTLGGFDVALAAVRRRIGRGADRLRVVAVRAPRGVFPVLDLPEKKETRWVESLLARWADSGPIDGVLLALTGERVLAWSDVAAGLAR